MKKNVYYVEYQLHKAFLLVPMEAGSKIPSLNNHSFDFWTY